MSGPVDVLDPWNVYAPSTPEELLTAAKGWRQEATRGGTHAFQQLCMGVAAALEAKAGTAALTNIGSAK